MKFLRAIGRREQRTKGWKQKIGEWILGKRRKKQKKKKAEEEKKGRSRCAKKTIVATEPRLPFGKQKTKKDLHASFWTSTHIYIYRQGGGGKPGNNLMAGSSSATGRCTTWGKSEKTSTPIAAKRAKERWGFFNLLYVYIFIRLYRTIGKRERKCKKGREKENRKLRATNEEENYWRQRIG